MDEEGESNLRDTKGIPKIFVKKIPDDSSAPAQKAAGQKVLRELSPRRNGQNSCCV